MAAGKVGKDHFTPIVGVKVMRRCSRWGLGGGNSRRSMLRSGSHGCSGWRGGFIGSDLLVCVFQILPQDQDLLLH